MSILPDLVDEAMQRGLEVDYKSLGKKEVRFTCPFCNRTTDSRGRKRKYYLSISTVHNVFKCWYCKESGGVLRFISLLDNISEVEALERIKEAKGIKPKAGPRSKVKKHPAEFLNARQLRMIDLKPEYYKAFCDLPRNNPARKYALDIVWNKWQSFLDFKKRQAYQELLIGIKSGRYSEAITAIQETANELRYDKLLEDVMAAYSSVENRPEWAEGAHLLVEAIYESIKI